MSRDKYIYFSDIMTQLWFKRLSHVFKWQITFYKSHFQKVKDNRWTWGKTSSPFLLQMWLLRTPSDCTWGRRCYEGWEPVELLQLGPVPATVCQGFTWPLLKTLEKSAQSHKGTKTREIIIYKSDVRFFSEVFEPFGNLCYIFSELQVQCPCLTTNAYEILLDY